MAEKLSDHEPIIHDAPNHLRIDQVWMIVSVDGKGDEGVAAATLSNGMIMPLVAADEARLPFIIEQAEHLSKLVRWKKFKLIKLTTREEVREIGG
ncbi:hypothetical protein [Bradyrhizobium sp. S3.7.6]